MSKFLINCNSNIICAIDCETTGPEAGFHDIIQVAVLALDSKLEPNREIIPFYCDLKPKRPENYESTTNQHKRHRLKVKPSRFAQVTTNGLDPYIAADLFDKWFEKLNLTGGKRIIPLAHNWQHDHRFIIDWLGEKTYQDYFDSRCRDTQVVAAYLNDCAEFHIEQPPHPKLDLSYLASVYRIPHERRHDALADCIITANLYRTIIKASLFKLQKENFNDVSNLEDIRPQVLIESDLKYANEHSTPGTLQHSMLALGLDVESEQEAYEKLKQIIAQNQYFLERQK